MAIERTTERAALGAAGSMPEAGFGTVMDRRSAALLEEQVRSAERKERLAAQCSPLNEPAERIRIWEQLHALNLPSAASHKLVRVIARQTDLSVRQVQDEQRRRAGGALDESTK